MTAQLAPHETPVVHVQAPAVHVRPVPHTVPHAPQLFGSLIRSTQAPEHMVLVPGHVATQVEPMQNGVVPPQALAHEPQCAGVSMRTQLLPQNIWPAAQPDVSGPTSAGVGESDPTSPTARASTGASARIEFASTPVSAVPIGFGSAVQPAPHPAARQPITHAAHRTEDCRRIF